VSAHDSLFPAQFTDVLPPCRMASST